MWKTWIYPISKHYFHEFKIERDDHVTWSLNRLFPLKIQLRILYNYVFAYNNFARVLPQGHADKENMQSDLEL